jgi:hypothetical protein
VDSDELAAQLWERIQPFAPAVYRSRRAVGINERFRFLRYNPGDTHHQHRDRSYVRGLEKGPEHEGEVSMITVQIYLNGVEEGGVTNIYNARDQDKLLPLGTSTASIRTINAYSNAMIDVVMDTQYRNPGPSSCSSTISSMMKI